MYRKKKRVVFWILIPILFVVAVAYCKIHNIPTTIFIREGENLKSNTLIKLNEKDKRVSVNVLGVLPVKSVNINSVSKNVTIYPGGQPIGVKLNTKGVLVVALTDIKTENGKITSPAALADIQIGDSIIKINDALVKNTEETKKEINDSDGKEMKVTVERKGEKLERIVKPVKSSDDSNYKIGLWIRDSTAGVGTLTFYDESSKSFAALGHPITDIDTGTILSISSGEVVPSSIVSVKKGVKGSPGELKGIFVNEEDVLGKIYRNTECGLFGKSNSPMINKCSKPMKIALRNEIKEGPAKILTTVEGTEPKYYDIEIEKLLSQDTPGPKSMVIRITDKELLEKTGGIVQGMSGSPIIQENRVVGAVTHVLINKPDVGYGIYIEWMLKDANILSK